MSHIRGTKGMNSKCPKKTPKSFAAVLKLNSNPPPIQIRLVAQEGRRLIQNESSLAKGGMDLRMTRKDMFAESLASLALSFLLQGREGEAQSQVLETGTRMAKEEAGC